MANQKLPLCCPSCENKLEVTNLTCSECNTKIEGVFTLPSILNLNTEEQLLMLDFVRSNGSPKALSKIYDLSYPAIRSRLDKLIEKLQDI